MNRAMLRRPTLSCTIAAYRLHSTLTAYSARFGLLFLYQPPFINVNEVELKHIISSQPLRLITVSSIACLNNCVYIKNIRLFFFVLSVQR